MIPPSPPDGSCRAGAGTVSLTFNEPVWLESFNVSGLTFTEFRDTAYGAHYRLANYTALHAQDTGKTVREA
jgi:hypothetical protein